MKQEILGKRRELIEKLNDINEKQLKQEKKEEKTKEFINQYRKLVEDKIKDNEAKIAEIKIKGEEAVQEKNKYLEIKTTIRGFSKKDYNKNEVYKATIVEIDKSSKKITEYIKEALKLQREITLCKAIQSDLDKKYVQNDLMQEETRIDEKEEQAQEQKVAEPKTDETKNNNEEKKENSEQSSGKEEKMNLVNEEYMNSLNGAWEKAKEDKVIENESIKAAEEEAKRIEEEAKVEEAKRREEQKVAEEQKRREEQKARRENGNVEIEYSAKDDMFLLKNMKNEKQYVSKISRTELEGIKDIALKDKGILSDENKEKMADAMIVDKNIQTHFLLLTYYDKKWNTNKAEEYLQKTSTIGKSKEQRQEDMDEISIKIKYDLKKFSKDVSKKDKKQIIKNAKGMKKTGLGEVKRGFLNSVKDKLSTIGSFMKRAGTNLTYIIGEEKLAELDEVYGKSTKESKPIVEHVDVDEKKAMEEADMKAAENVKNTEKSKEM